MSKTFHQYILQRFINKPNVFKKETQLNCKILVRKHLKNVTNKLPQVYFIGNINKCDFTKLPKDYVIKPRCMYGGKGITFVINNINLRTKKEIDVKQIKQFYTLFKSNRGINNHIIIEEFLLDKNNNPIKEDYKFFVFGDKVKIISLIKNINQKNHTKIDYDINWNRVKVHSTLCASLDIKYQKPNNLNEMIELAEKLGKFYYQFTGIPFVRVDLFDTNNGIIFGEYTGGPNGGKKITKEYQILFGKYWKDTLIKYKK